MPITVSAPDLTITSASAPSGEIEGQSILVSWTVQNIGAVEAPGHWYDAIFVGTSPTFGEGSNIFVANFSESDRSSLAAGASYIDSESIVLPAVPAGSGYLFFITNYSNVVDTGGGTQGETDDSNNLYSLPIALSAPDLTVTAASAPSSGTESQSIGVSWSVQNIGAVEAPGSWYDAIYISSSPNFDANDDTYITDFSESGQSPLAAGASYTDNETIVLPASVVTGDEYLIFVTNYYALEGEYNYSEQGETDFTNNTFVVPIMNSAPDLTITGASARRQALRDNPSQYRGQFRTSARSRLPASGTTPSTSAARLHSM